MVMGTPRGIGIVRVSQRADDTGHSPEVQARAMLRQAGTDGFTLAAEDIWDENVDDNGRVRPKSGGASLADRPKLLAAVEAVERREAQVITAERFDRLFRDLDLQREVIRRVEAAGGRLVTANGQISHATAEAELQANLNGAVAQYTKRTAIERSRAAVQVAIEQGKIPWHGLTPGYRRTPQGRYELDPERFEAAATAIWLRAQPGITVENVRTYMAANGWPGILLRRVQEFLKSRVTRGEINFGTYHPNLRAHTALVDEPTWRAAQHAQEPRGRRAKSERLLSRLRVLRCGNCGGTMVINSFKGQYRCGSHNECDHRYTVGADVADQVVADAVRRAIADERGRASTDKNARKAEAELERAQKNLEAAIEVLSDFTEPSAAAKLEALRADRDDAQVQVDQLGSMSRSVTITAGKDWDRLDLRERRALIDTWIRQAVVGPGEGATRIRVELFGE